MSLKSFTYRLFYFTSSLVVLVIVFARDLMIYFKPPVILSLCLLYFVNAGRRNYLVLLSLLLLMICEILYFQDYLNNFKNLHVLLSMYYFLNVVLLWKSLQVVKIGFKKIFTVQLIISMALIAYVLFSVAELILPQVDDHNAVLNMLVFFFAFFIGVCYYIYLNSKTVVSYSLMIAASCFLIVNIITALNRLYVSVEIFPVITTILQIFGQFFLVKFYMEQHKLTPNGKDYF